MEHPFLFSRFKIKSSRDIAAIRKLGLSEVIVIPAYSDIEVAPAAAPEQGNSSDESVEALWRQKKERIDQAQRYRNRRNSVFQHYQQRSQAVRKIARDLINQPANAIHVANDFIETLALEFEDQGDLLLNLVNLNGSAHSFYNHSVNVTILSLMLAKAEGLRGDSLRRIGMGALLHDIGKVEVPASILNKPGSLSHAETEIFQRHTVFGRKLIERVRYFPGEILDIVDHHHEFLDGTGYPHRKSGEKIPHGARLVAVADTYDALCNPRARLDALTPKTALAIMYTRYKNKLDTHLVERFIREIGVYPPGTVVKLSDGGIGLVVTADALHPLRPEVLLYNPDIPSEQALIVNLKEHNDLTVREVVPPQEHPRRIYSYLGIENRLGYFVERRPS